MKANLGLYHVRKKFAHVDIVLTKYDGYSTAEFFTRGSEQPCRKFRTLEISEVLELDMSDFEAELNDLINQYTTELWIGINDLAMSNHVSKLSKEAIVNKFQKEFNEFKKESIENITNNENCRPSR